MTNPGEVLRKRVAETIMVFGEGERGVTVLLDMLKRARAEYDALCEQELQAEDSEYTERFDTYQDVPF